MSVGTSGGFARGPGEGEALWFNRGLGRAEGDEENNEIEDRTCDHDKPAGSESDLCTCEEDLPKLEWYGEYLHFRRVFRRAYDDQLAGRRLMLLAAAHRSAATPT